MDPRITKVRELMAELIPAAKLCDFRIKSNKGPEFAAFKVLASGLLDYLDEAFNEMPTVDDTGLLFDDWFGSIPYTYENMEKFDPNLIPVIIMRACVQHHKMLFHMSDPNFSRFGMKYRVVIEGSSNPETISAALNSIREGFDTRKGISEETRQIVMKQYFDAKDRGALDQPLEFSMKARRCV